jgi:hypothetical protein
MRSTSASSWVCVQRTVGGSGALVDALKDIGAVLADADPKLQAQLYEELGITVRYDPPTRIVVAQAGQQIACATVSVGGAFGLPNLEVRMNDCEYALRAVHPAQVAHAEVDEFDGCLEARPRHLGRPLANHDFARSGHRSESGRAVWGRAAQIPLPLLRLTEIDRHPDPDRPLGLPCRRAQGKLGIYSGRQRIYGMFEDTERRVAFSSRPDGTPSPTFNGLEYAAVMRRQRPLHGRWIGLPKGS